MGQHEQEISLKKIFSCISIVEFVFYVLLFVTQSLPTWENKAKTLAMQTDS